MRRITTEARFSRPGGPSLLSRRRPNCCSGLRAPLKKLLVATLSGIAPACRNVRGSRIGGFAYSATIRQIRCRTRSGRRSMKRAIYAPRQHLPAAAEKAQFCSFPNAHNRETDPLFSSYAMASVLQRHLREASSIGAIRVRSVPSEIVPCLRLAHRITIPPFCLRHCGSADNLRAARRSATRRRHRLPRQASRKRDRLLLGLTMRTMKEALFVALSEQGAGKRGRYGPALSASYAQMTGTLMPSLDL